MQLLHVDLHFIFALTMSRLAYKALKAFEALKKELTKVINVIDQQGDNPQGKNSKKDLKDTSPSLAVFQNIVLSDCSLISNICVFEIDCLFVLLCCSHCYAQCKL